MRLALALAAISAASLSASLASAQQELYALTRFNSIWRIDGFDTANPVPTFITNWAGPSCNCGPVGLEVDPATGDFLVLASGWSSFSDGTELLRVDPQTGDTTLVLSLPFDDLSGLDRRWDGQFITLSEGNTLLTFDLLAGVTDITPLSAQLQFPAAQFAGFDLDARGIPHFLSLPSATVDPVSGAVTPSSLPTLSLNSQSCVAISNAGDFYGGSFFPASIHRYDAIAGVWDPLFSLPVASPMSNIYDLAFTDGTTGLGFAEVCPGVPNSSGAAATMELIGLSTVAAQDLQLVTRNLPASSFGFYLMGTNQANISVGAGQLCIGQTIHRYLDTLSAVQRVYSFDVDLMDLPNGQPAMANTTQIFQFWYRDTVHGFATSNFSAAASVTFR